MYVHLKNTAAQQLKSSQVQEVSTSVNRALARTTDALLDCRHRSASTRMGGSVPLAGMRESSPASVCPSSLVKQPAVAPPVNARRAGAAMAAYGRRKVRRHLPFTRSNLGGWTAGHPFPEEEGVIGDVVQRAFHVPLHVPQLVQACTAPRPCQPWQPPAPTP